MMMVLRTQWHYLFDENLKRQGMLAEIVAHAISRIELLNGEDGICVVEEYKEWLGDGLENDVMALEKIKSKS